MTAHPILAAGVLACIGVVTEGQLANSIERLPERHRRSVLRFERAVVPSDLQAIIAQSSVNVISIRASASDFTANYVLHADEPVDTAIAALLRDIDTIRAELASVHGMGPRGRAAIERQPASQVSIIEMAVEGTPDNIEALRMAGRMTEATAEEFLPAPAFSGNVRAVAEEGIVPFASAAFAPDVGWISYDHQTRIVYSYFYWLSTDWSRDDGKVGYEHDLTIFDGLEQGRR